MSAAVLGRIFNTRRVPPQVKLALLVLANNAQDESGMCHISERCLCEGTGLSSYALMIALRKAQKLGLLRLDTKPGKGMVLAWDIGGTA